LPRRSTAWALKSRASAREVLPDAPCPASARFRTSSTRCFDMGNSSLEKEWRVPSGQWRVNCGRRRDRGGFPVCSRPSPLFSALLAGEDDDGGKVETALVEGTADDTGAQAAPGQASDVVEGGDAAGSDDGGGDGGRDFRGSLDVGSLE